MTIEYLADRREFVPVVAKWLHDEWGHLRSGDTIETRAARIERNCGHSEIPTSFVATEVDDVVGCASLIENDMETRPELSPWLAGVFVPAAHRGRGIGTALIMQVLKEAQTLHIPRIYLYTPGPGTLYRRLGWSIVERTFYRPLWKDQQVTIMERAISL